MIMSRVIPSLSALVVGLAFSVSSTPAAAGSWGVSFGGYSGGHHYSVGYRDHGRSYRGHRGGLYGIHYGAPSYYYYGGPRYRYPTHYYGSSYSYGYYAPAHYPRTRVMHGGYYSPVVIRNHAPRRVDGQVRYYNHRPTPRRGYDRSGYGNQYRSEAASRSYEYDEVDVAYSAPPAEAQTEERWIDDTETYQAYPDDAPGRIERR